MITNCQVFPQRNGKHPKLVSFGGRAILYKTDFIKVRLEIHVVSSHLSEFCNRFFLVVSEYLSFFIQENPYNVLLFSVYLA